MMFDDAVPAWLYDRARQEVEVVGRMFVDTHALLLEHGVDAGALERSLLAEVQE